MSYAELLCAGDDGCLEAYAEYKNAHGYTAFIWDMLVDKYRQQIGASELGFMSDWSLLWRWVRDSRPKLDPWEMNVLVMSYDRAYLQGVENMKIYAESLEIFSQALARPHRVNHLPQIALHLREAAEDGMQYVAWYGMSVGENLFFVNGDEEDDEGHLLCFLNEEDMKKVSPAKWKMAPLDGGQVDVHACEDNG